MPFFSPVIFAAFHLKNDDFVCAPMSFDAGFDGDPLNLGRAHLDFIAATHEQDIGQGEGRSFFGIEPRYADILALSHLVLAAGDIDHSAYI